MIPYLFIIAIYSRTEIVVDLRRFDSVEDVEDSGSQCVNFIEELIAESLIESMPALLRGLQFR